MKTARTKHRRARCRACGWPGTVNNDGGMRKHPSRNKFGEIVDQTCSGTARPPHGEPYPPPKGATPS